MTLIVLLCVAVVLALISSDAIHGRWAWVKTIEVSGSRVPVNDSLRLNRFTEEDFVKDVSGRVRYLNGAYRTGVDVSVFQDKVDWAKVAGDGISFAMVRAGSRSFSTGELRTDKYLKRNVKGAAKNGLDVGVYFFSQAITPEEAVEEAQYLIEQLDGLSLTLPVVFDWEQVQSDLDEEGVSRTQGVDGDTITDCALSFFQTMEAAGYSCMLYCNGETGYFTYDLARLQDYPVWYASYSTSWPNYYYGVDLWQYTDSGKVKGIDGWVDLDLMPVDEDPDPLNRNPAAQSSAEPS
jgi:GH25 family lysozyme M1 (1,4-beta-N-acetylmuramidase)